MKQLYLLGFAILTLFMTIGCAKGPLWRTGYLSPMARRQWAEEEQIAQTFISKKADLQAMVARAREGSPPEQEKCADTLVDHIKNNQILLMRIESTRLLGELVTPSADDGLRLAARDPDSDVRLMAVSAMAKRKGAAALQTLQELIGSDTNMDVRLAATRALGEFKGDAVEQALSLALTDRDPALQARAVEALEQASGKSMGLDVVAWQEYLASKTPVNPSDGTIQRASAELADGEEQFIK